MRNTVIAIDLASGPNISLPPQRNICQVEQAMISLRTRKNSNKTASVSEST